MDINKKPWPLPTLFGLRERIDTNPDFQRPAVWSRSQKQLLMDSILRGYDVPKVYFRKTGSKPDTYDVVDGQQRLRAIWEFYGGGYPLASDADPVDGHEVKGARFADLPQELRVTLDTYSLDVIVMEDTDEDEVREMFLRLQNGTTLKAQEKRNAMPGAMRDFVKGLATHAFFNSVGFQNSRYAHDNVAAQMTLIELNGGPCHVRNSNLNRMYEDHKGFDGGCKEARKVRRVLDALHKAFPEKTPELERFSVVSLYLMVSELLEGYAFGGREPDLAAWFIDFETWRRQDEDRPNDERDPDAVVYKEKTSHTTDSKDSVEWRHDFLMSRFLERCPDVPQKDPQREFTHHQRMAVYRRDGCCCRVQIACDGAKCVWDNWHCDHIKPWSQGGPTVVANGQVSCPECNARKGAD